jgi:hypothetical protein
MLINVVDADGATQTITVQAQDEINDLSGVLGAGAVGPAAAPQQVAAANPGRSGFLYQNNSPNAMLLFESGDTVASWTIVPGGFFPFLQGYPVPTGALFVQGGPASVAGDAFTYREWVNSPNS